LTAKINFFYFFGGRGQISQMSEIPIFYLILFKKVNKVGKVFLGKFPKVSETMRFV